MNEVFVYAPVGDESLDACYNSLGMSRDGEYTCF